MLEELMKKNGVTEDELKSVLASKGYYPTNCEVLEYSESFVKEILLPNWENLLQAVLENRANGSEKSKLNEEIEKITAEIDVVKSMIITSRCFVDSFSMVKEDWAKLNLIADYFEVQFEQLQHMEKILEIVNGRLYRLAGE